MASITYTDLDKSAPTVTVKGVEFKDGEAVESNDAELVKSLAGNPYFKICGGEQLEPHIGDGDANASSKPATTLASASKPTARK